VRTVPQLVAARDPADALVWRERRRNSRRRDPELPLAVALATDGADSQTAFVLRDAGVEVVGLLAPEPLESLAWAAEAGAPRAYGDLVSMLSDEVEAVCVETGPPGSDVVALRAAEVGLHVLLARPATADSEVLREVADVAEDRGIAHVVALDGRAWPAAGHVQARIGSLGRLSQVTVLGAPSGSVGRTEVVDLVSRWCGDLLAVCADPDAMPALELTSTAPVTLALLTTSGATVLVNERMGGRFDTAVVTVCGDAGRIVVEGRRVRRQDQSGLREFMTPVVPAERPGLVEATYDLVRVAELGDSDLVRGATFYDLLVVTQILEAADRSRRYGGWVEL
jgi:predicted dehydrogenase